MSRKTGMQIPATLEELEKELAKHKPLDENFLFRCRCCNHRDYYDVMRGFQYPKPGCDATLDDMVYFCVSCLDQVTYDFIMANKIDVRILEPREIVNIQAAYYDGSYDRWVEERRAEG